MLFILTLPSCQEKEAITREEVVAAIQRFDEGWKNKNAKIVDSILAPGYVYFTQSGGTYGKKNVVHTAGSPDYQLASLTRQQFDIIIEGNTAIANTTWVGKGVYFEAPFNDNQRCSITLIKTNGKVEILSEHCTPIR